MKQNRGCSFFPLRALHPFESKTLQKRIEFLRRVSGERAIERSGDFLVAPALKKRLERDLDELAAGDAKVLGGCLGFLEQRIGDGNAIFIPAV
jgi:hypothetical protein